MSATVLIRPSTIAQATDALRQPGAVALAGGTDLMNGLRLGHLSPPVVVDLGGLAELRHLGLVDNGLTIGAGVTMRQFLGDTDAIAAAPALSDAARLLGGRQIQSSATFGGNVCNASPAAETATALLVHGARANVAGPAGARCVPLADVWAGPGRTTLTPGELLVSLTIPIAPHSSSAYRRLELRRSVDIALVSASAFVSVIDGAITEARIAIGAAAPTPLLVPTAAAELLGTTVADLATVQESIKRAGLAASAASSPITDHRASADYRKAMVAEVTCRALAGALGVA